MHEHTEAAHMFGQALRHLRQRAGLSQRELSRRALYDHTRISRAEQGEIIVPAEQVKALDTALGADGVLLELRHALDRKPLSPASRDCSQRCTCGHGLLGYRQKDHSPIWPPAPQQGELMTTASGLPAVRESLRLALLDTPHGDPVIAELAQAAVEHYALNYSKHPPTVLFDEVHATRGLLAGALAAPAPPDVALELRRAAGWLSGLLGNLAYHLADHTGARAHLAVAATLGQHTGDARLTAWAYGAQSMVALHRGAPVLAQQLAETGFAHAPTPLARAQVLGWAMLPALARLDQAAAADHVLRDATNALDTAAGGEPGRFGFDAAELALHEADAHLTLGRHDQAATRAEASAADCIPETPGWAAATLVLAQAEAAREAGDAASRGLDVLARVPAERLRSTARARLDRLAAALTGVDTAAVRDLAEHVRALPPAIDAHGRGLS